MRVEPVPLTQPHNLSQFLSFTCADIAGTLRWITTHTLRYEPMQEWPPHRVCSLHLNASMQAWDQASLRGLDIWPNRGKFDFFTPDLKYVMCAHQMHFIFCLRGLSFQIFTRLSITACICVDIETVTFIYVCKNNADEQHETWRGSLCACTTFDGRTMGSLHA
jgi:hypothetical protein